jgi:hypothetical protein
VISLCAKNKGGILRRTEAGKFVHRFSVRPWGCSGDEGKKCAQGFGFHETYQNCREPALGREKHWRCGALDLQGVDCRL